MELIQQCYFWVLKGQSQEKFSFYYFKLIRQLTYFCETPLTYNEYKLTNLIGSLGESVGKIYQEIGFNGLWRGLATRIIMIGTLTGFQWWIYDTFKTAVGLQTTGGSAAAKPVQSCKN